MPENASADVPPEENPEPERPDEFTASLSPELRAQEEYLRAQIAARPPMTSRPEAGQYGH